MLLSGAFHAELSARTKRASGCLGHASSEYSINDTQGVSSLPACGRPRRRLVCWLWWRNYLKRRNSNYQQRTAATVSRRPSYRSAHVDPQFHSGHWKLRCVPWIADRWSLRTCRQHLRGPASLHRHHCPSWKKLLLRRHCNESRFIGKRKFERS